MDLKDLTSLPKEILNKAEKSISVVFGKSINEFSEILADQMRLRRFKNQIMIYSKAEE